MEKTIEQRPKNEIRGVVLSMYPNISSFAQAMNWTRQKASRIVNKKQSPNIKEMEQMALCLGIKDVNSFVHIFLPFMDTMCPSKNE